ncbi:hypothetical protein [Hymenobacter mucosus]|uniref:SpoIIAA-like n=1 Tax=Hymenobacter mucosus TaxID=1411120 RepID=A0A238ZAS7_9BACT|nr:hypothetical protein [Hymenobacter mucosus]SNR80088.1 hypothetical protein SAMN06269173_10749 [Hymenobacter mucosus]
MLISNLVDSDGSRCTLTFEEDNQWLRATWRGFIDQTEAMRGATNYLEKAVGYSFPYLLNDNVDLHGPWFDSVEWLQNVWLPRALQLGLRHIAHVVQKDTGTDILSVTFPQPVDGDLELQLFHDVAEAEEWLRSCQARANN